MAEGLLFSPGGFYFPHHLNLSLGDCRVSLTPSLTSSRVSGSGQTPVAITIQSHRCPQATHGVSPGCRAGAVQVLLQGPGCCFHSSLEAAAPSEHHKSTGTSLEAALAMQESLVSLPTGRGQGMRRGW